MQKLATLFGLIVTLSLANFVAATTESTEVLEPDDDLVRTAKMVVDQVRHNHFTQNTRLNDEVSSEIFDQYFESLDPRRVFFLADTVAEFEQKYRYAFDDALKLGKLEPAFEIFNEAHRARLDRYNWVLDRLAQGIESFDLTTDGTVKERDEESSWPVDQEQADQLWEKILVDSLIRLGLSESDDERDRMEVLNKRYERYRRNESQVRSDEAFAAYINAFTTWFDPHTVYLTQSEEDQFNIQMSLSLQGIGAVLTPDEDFIKIERLVPGGPAELHGGVKEGDRIVSVGQDPEGPLEDVVGWRLDDVVDLIRGPKGTNVVLQLVAPGDESPKRVVTIVRDEVRLEESAATSQVLEVEESGQVRRVGVIDLPSMYVDFDAKRKGDPNYRSATQDVRRLIRELKGDQIDALIIDLRNNGGGSLEEAHTLTGLFIPTGPTVLVKPSRSRVSVYRDSNPELAWDGPLAVVVNHRSASASEIFAGAIQDYGRGIIVGNQTFGKGTVQQLVQVKRGQLKITQAKYYRITGQSTQHKGVEPDIKFPEIVDTEAFGESKFDSALAHDVVEGPVYKRFGDLSEYFPKLRESHFARTEDNPDFVYFRTVEQRILDDREKDEYSLNEQVRKGEKDEYDDWRLNVINQRLIGKGKEPAENLDDLEDILKELDEEEEENEIPNAVLVEVAHILNDLINIDLAVAVAEKEVAEEAL